jgi:hypothetical protein
VHFSQSGVIITVPWQVSRQQQPAPCWRSSKVWRMVFKGTTHSLFGFAHVDAEVAADGPGGRLGGLGGTEEDAAGLDNTVTCSR